MGTEDLDASMDLILDSLPEYHDDESGNQRRAHALTKGDMKLITDAIKVAVRNQPCSLKFTEEQAESILSMVRERKRILALIGGAILTLLAYIGQKTLEVLAPDLWKKVAHWMLSVIR